MREDSILVIGAAPFERGALLGALPGRGNSGPCILKGRSGLLTGIGLGELLRSHAAQALRARRAGPEDIDDWLRLAQPVVPGLAGGARFFFSHEVVPDSGGIGWGEGGSSRYLGEPVRLFQGSEAQTRRIYRASLLAASGVPDDLTREAELRLHWELDQGSSAEVRLRALVLVLGWLAERLETAGEECEIGIHETDLHYSVDRTGWGDL